MTITCPVLTLMWGPSDIESESFPVSGSVVRDAYKLEIALVSMW